MPCSRQLSRTKEIETHALCHNFPLAIHSLRLVSTNNNKHNNGKCLIQKRQNTPTQRLFSTHGAISCSLMASPTSPASADGVPAESKPFEDALRGCTLKYTHGTMKIWWVRFLMFLQVSSCRISGSFLSLPLITDMWHDGAWQKTSAWLMTMFRIRSLMFDIFFWELCQRRIFFQWSNFWHDVENTPTDFRMCRRFLILFYKCILLSPTPPPSKLRN